MHDNSMSAERLRARSVLQACCRRWKRGDETRYPQRIVAAPPADAKNICHVSPQAAAGGVIGLVEESDITEICVRGVPSIWL